LTMAVAEGKEFEFLPVEAIRTDFLETFPFESPGQYIRTETKELMAVCPFSGLPDFGRLLIEYYPSGGKCIELKSLKYYLISFKNVGIYQEGLTRKIYVDLKSVLNTEKIKISTFYN